MPTSRSLATATRIVALLVLLVSAIGCPPKRPTPDPSTGGSSSTGNGGASGTLSAVGGSGGHAGAVTRLVGLGKSLSAATKAYDDGSTAIDIDGDGAADWFITRDANGKPSAERIDLNHDGIAEQTVERSDDAVTVTHDANGDRGVTQILAIALNPTGAHVERTFETLGSVTPNWRVSFDLGIHSDELTLQHWKRADSGSFQPVLTTTTDRTQAGVTVVTSPPLACPSRVDELLLRAEQDGADCLGQLSSDLASDFVRSMIESTITIDCQTQQGPTQTRGGVDELEVFRCISDPSKCSVAIHLTNIDGASDRGLAGLIFHELLHAIGLVHFLGDGLSDPEDQVYACQRECFPESEPPAGNASACIGDACPAGTTSCGGECTVTACADHTTFNPNTCKCEGPDCSQATYCPCNDSANGKPRNYDSEGACAVQCPSGLSCFTTLCQPPPNCPN